MGRTGVALLGSQDRKSTAFGATISRIGLVLVGAMLLLSALPVLPAQVGVPPAPPAPDPGGFPSDWEAFADLLPEPVPPLAGEDGLLFPLVELLGIEDPIPPALDQVQEDLNWILAFIVDVQAQVTDPVRRGEILEDAIPLMLGIAEPLQPFLPPDDTLCNSFPTETLGPIGSYGSVGSICLNGKGAGSYSGGEASFGSLGGIYIDFGGNDDYTADIGTSFGAVGGIFIELEGDDSYSAGSISFGVVGGTFIDAGGNDEYEMASLNGGVAGTVAGAAGSGSSTGFGSYGGQFRELEGDDSYHAFGENFGSTAGVFVDVAGNDEYESEGPFSFGASVRASGLFLDGAGNDAYTGAGFSFGIDAGVFVDLDGDDSYMGSLEMSLGAGFVTDQRPGGTFIDRAGDDLYEPGLDQNFGYTGDFYDLAGDDTYNDLAATGASAFGSGGATGLPGRFFDIGGLDVYQGAVLTSSDAFGRGNGVFVDSEGSKEPQNQLVASRGEEAPLPVAIPSPFSLAPDPSGLTDLLTDLADAITGIATGVAADAVPFAQQVAGNPTGAPSALTAFLADHGFPDPGSIPLSCPSTAWRIITTTPFSRGPVSIASDADFEGTEGAQNSVCAGTDGFDFVLPDVSVSPSNPFPPGAGTGAVALIEVSGTSKNFLIRGSTLSGAGEVAGTGILLADTTGPITIEEVSVGDGDIVLEGVDDVTILDSAAQRLVVRDSTNVRIVGLTLTGPNEPGAPAIVEIVDSDVTAEGLSVEAGGLAGLDGILISGSASDVHLINAIVGGTAVDGTCLRATGDAVVWVEGPESSFASCGATAVVGSGADTVMVQDVALWPSLTEPLMVVSATRIAQLVDVSATDAEFSITADDVEVRGSFFDKSHMLLQGADSIRVSRSQFVDGDYGLDLSAIPANRPVWIVEDSLFVDESDAGIVLHSGLGAGQLSNSTLAPDRPDGLPLRVAGSVPASAYDFVVFNNAFQTIETFGAPPGSTFQDYFSPDLSLDPFLCENRVDGLSDTCGGNAWPIYAGYDVDSDGIGELSHTPEGLEGVADDAPLTPPNNAPTVTRIFGTPDPRDELVNIQPFEPLILEADFFDLDDDPITAYQWDFGDGPAADPENLTQYPGVHIYETAGVFEIRLVAFDSLGAPGVSVPFAITIDPYNHAPEIVSPPTVGHSPDCAEDPDAPYYYREESLCFQVDVEDADHGIHDRLDLLVLDADDDARLTVNDVILGRAPEPLIAPGVVSEFDLSLLGAPLSFTTETTDPSDLPALPGGYPVALDSFGNIYLDLDQDGFASHGDLRLFHGDPDGDSGPRPTDSDSEFPPPPSSGIDVSTSPPDPPSSSEPSSSASESSSSTTSSSTTSSSDDSASTPPPADGPPVDDGSDDAVVAGSSMGGPVNRYMAPATRVRPTDDDAGGFLDVPGFPIAFALGSEGYYLDLGADGLVSVGDLRMGGMGFGTRVQVDDPDVGLPVLDLDADLMPLRVFDRNGEARVQWDLQDGVPLLGEQITKSYRRPGYYNVRAEGRDAGEPAKLESQGLQILVRSETGATADFVTDDVTACGPTTCTVPGRIAITYISTSVASDYSPIVEYEWNFDDGTVEVAGVETMEHTFLFPGVYDVRLTVTTDDGLATYVEKRVSVTSTPPTIFVEWTPEVDPTTNDVIEFTAAGSTDIGTAVASFAAEVRWADLDGDGLRTLADIVALDVDADGQLSRDDLQLAPLAPVTDSHENLGAVFEEFDGLGFCMSDVDADGAFGSSDELYVAASPCSQSQPGDIRMQEPLAGLGAGTVIADFDPDVTAPLGPLPAGASLGRDARGNVYLDMNDDGSLSPGDVRLPSIDGRKAGSRVLPASSDADGQIVSYEWTCYIGCAATPVVMSRSSTFEVGPGRAFRFVTSGIEKQIILVATDNNGIASTYFTLLQLANLEPDARIGYTLRAPAGIDLPVQATDLHFIRFDGTPSNDPDGAIRTYMWDFGDGTTSSQSVVEKRYADPGVYAIQLNVTDDGGLAELADSASFQLRVANVPPLAKFTPTPASPLTETPVQFDATASRDYDGEIVSYTWDFGDATSGAANQATGRVASHSYAKGGAYEVTLTIQDDASGDNVAILKKPLTVVNRKPIVKVQVDQPVQLPPATLSFTSTGTEDPDGSVVNYTWDFRDGGFAYGASARHEFTKRGLFNVTLTARDDQGGMGAESILITILNQPPRPSILAPDDVQTGVSSVFEGLAYDPEGDSVKYRWDFGDGVSSAPSANPKASHTYTKWGDYKVILTATDSGQASANVSLFIRVLSQRPSAMLEADRTEALIGEEIVFTGSGEDGDGEVRSHFIDLGDGTTAFASEITHRYERPGTYTVLYRVTDDSEASGTDSLLITIENPAPTIESIGLSTNDPRVGDIVLFSVVAADDDLLHLEYFWNFNDGVVSTFKTPTHVFRLPGTFTVELTVTDAFGSEIRESKTVQVFTQSGEVANEIIDVGPLETQVPPEVQRRGSELPAVGALGSLLILLLMPWSVRRR